MIKSELIQKIAVGNQHLYHRDIERIVNVVFNEIVEALARGDRVELRGFGAFTVKHRARGWFYWPTYHDKTEAKGPYSSLASVTLMIASQLKREIAKRDAIRGAVDVARGGTPCVLPAQLDVERLAHSAQCLLGMPVGKL